MIVGRVLNSVSLQLSFLEEIVTVPRGEIVVEEYPFNWLHLRCAKSLRAVKHSSYASGV